MSFWGTRVDRNTRPAGNVLVSPISLETATHFYPLFRFQLINDCLTPLTKSCPLTLHFHGTMYFALLHF